MNGVEGDQVSNQLFYRVYFIAININSMPGIGEGFLVLIKATDSLPSV